MMWVGLSDKKDVSGKRSMPLNEGTVSGKLIAEIENRCGILLSHKTNLVKFAPLDICGKLRYPTVEECATEYPKLAKEIRNFRPDVVFLLGQKVSMFVLNRLGAESYSHRFDLEGVSYVPLYHPSYVAAYGRRGKSAYIRLVKQVIEEA